MKPASSPISIAEAEEAGRVSPGRVSREPAQRLPPARPGVRQWKHAARMAMDTGDLRQAIACLRCAREQAPRDPGLARTIILLESLLRRHEPLLASGRSIGFPETVFEVLCAELKQAARHSGSASDAIALVLGPSSGCGSSTKLVEYLAGLRPTLRLHAMCPERAGGLGPDSWLPRLLELRVDPISSDPTPAALDEAADLLDLHGDLLALLPGQLELRLLASYAAFVRVRPRAVHLSQERDAPIYALAAALAGVPRIVLETRGRRPAKLASYAHRVYRALIRLPGVTIYSSSAIGARDHEAWLELTPGQVACIATHADREALWHDVLKVQARSGSRLPQITGAAACMPIDGLRAAAREHLARENHETAAELCGRLTALRPLDAGALVAAGSVALSTREPGAAERQLAAAVRLRPGSPEAWGLLASALAVRDRRAEWLGASRRLAALAPAPLAVRMRLFEVLQATRQLEIAGLVFCSALEIGPDDPRALRAAATAAERIGDLGAALAWLERLLAILPRDFEACLRGGDLALGLGRFAQGERLLRRAMATAPADDRPVQVLVRQLLWMGRGRDARAVLRQALRANPRNARLWGVGFELLREIGNAAAANRLLRRVLSDEDSLFAADVLAAADQPESAKRALLQMRPRTGAVASRLVRILLAEGSLREAERLAPSADQEEEAGLLEEARALVRPTRSRRNLREAFLELVDRDIDRRKDEYRPRRGVVLHVTGSLAAGGTERQLAAIAAAQQRRGHPLREVCVLRAETWATRRSDFFAPQLRQAGVRLATFADFALDAHRVSAEFASLADYPGASLGIHGLNDARILVAAIRAIRPEVVHTWTPYFGASAAIAALLLRVPRIILRSGSVAPSSRTFQTERERDVHAWVRLLTQFALGHPATRLINNCRANLDDWLRWLAVEPGDVEDRCGVVPNLLDRGRLGEPEPEAPAALRQRLGIEPAHHVVGAVTRLEREKGIDLWLETAVELLQRRGDVRFVLVGNGRLRSTVESFVRARNLSGFIHVVGEVNAGLSAYYSIFDVFLLTSHFEGLPNSLLEAQHHGVPAVAANVGGIPEGMAADLTGLTVSGRLPQDYADAIERLLDHPLERREMSKAAQLFTAARFTDALVLNALDGWYSVQNCD